MALDQFVSTVRALSGQGNFYDLCDYLSKSGEALLARNVFNLDNVLEPLDVQEHSLGVLAVLTVKLQQQNTSASDWDKLFNRITSFISECNGEQIRYSPASFAEFCHLFTNELIQRNSAIGGIDPILKAIGKLQLIRKSLTSVHADLLKLCLSAKCFAPALPVLDVDYLDLSRELPSEPEYLLLFFYYGGLIYAALKKFQSALYYFEVVITVPTIAVSHVMLEAYKKYLLVSLLIAEPSKDCQVLPKYTSPVINKFMKNLCAPYHDIVNAYFNNSKAQELQNVIEKHSEVFARDCNLGLVNQVHDAQIKTNIKRLTKTFLTLSLEDVAARVSLASSLEAERKLVEMIQQGSIHARISQKDGMVRFDSNPEHFDSVNMLQNLESNINKCIELDKQILSMEEEIMLNPNYIKKSSGGRDVADSDEVSSGTSTSAAQTGNSTPGHHKTGNGGDGGGGVSSGSKLPGYSM